MRRIIVMAFDLTQFLRFVPQFNFGEAVLLLISSLIGTAIIYLWMKIFHEPPHPGHAFGVALLANLQNYFVPFLALMIPIPYAFQLIPVLLWVLLIRIFYPELDWKHAFAIGLLSYGANSLLQGTGIVEIIQRMIPIRF